MNTKRRIMTLRQETRSQLLNSDYTDGNSTEKINK